MVASTKPVESAKALKGRQQADGTAPRSWHGRLAVVLARAGSLSQNFSVPELGHCVFDGSRGLLLHHFCVSCHRHVAVHGWGCSARIMAERFSVPAHLGVRWSDRRSSARTVAWTIRKRRGQGCLAGYPANDDRARLVVVGPLPAIGNTYLNNGDGPRKSVRIGGPFCLSLMSRNHGGKHQAS